MQPTLPLVAAAGDARRVRDCVGVFEFILAGPVVTLAAWLMIMRGEPLAGASVHQQRS